MDRSRVNPNFNNHNADTTSYGHNERLIKALARKGFKRLQDAGASTVEYADVEQEMTLAWMMATRRFDADEGVHFSTYFVTAAWFNFNRWADSLILAAHHENAIEEMGIEGREWLETIADDTATLPDEWVKITQGIAFAAKKCSAFTQLVLESMVNPSDELMHELRAAQAHAEMHRQIGIEKRAPRSLTVEFVVRHYARPFQMNESKVRRVITEVRKELTEAANGLE